MDSLRRILVVFIVLSFLFTNIIPPTSSYATQGAINLPSPGSMVNLSPGYVPVLMKGIKLHSENPLVFDFIMDTGNSGLKTDNAGFRSESIKLIKYFLAALTINEDDIWVNLSPYEKDRMITKDLSQTQLGRDMLAQDYILKQLSASLIYPEKDLGKKFWERVYEKIRQTYGTDVQIPVNTLNKVWIVADKAKVFEHGNAGFVVSGHLKVMMEEDYLALEKHNSTGQIPQDSNNSHSLAASVVRDLVIPEIEQEVNQGKNFAPLRQMFYSMILASWYKQALRNDLLNQVYSDKKKTAGVGVADPQHSLKVDEIYQRYLQAYRKGVFNYIKEDYDTTIGQTIPRKYFSGGAKLQVGRILQTSQTKTLDVQQSLPGVGECAITVAKIEGVEPVKSQAMISYAQELQTRAGDLKGYLDVVEKFVKDNLAAQANLLSVAAAVEETLNQWDPQLRKAALLALPNEALSQNLKDEVAQIIPGTQEREAALKNQVTKAETFLDQVVRGGMGHPKGWDKVVITSTAGMTPLYEAYLKSMVGVLFNKDVKVRVGNQPVQEGPEVIILDERDFHGVDSQGRPFEMVAGKPVGNGGATAAVFRYLKDQYGSNVFKNSIMVLHAGGAGKRLPEAIAEGTKALTVVPRALPNGKVSTNLAEGIRNTYQMSEKVRKAGGGIYVTNCDGFLMTDFDNITIENDRINILTAPANITRIAGSLGVLLDDPNSHEVVKFSEKPKRGPAAEFFKDDPKYLSTGLTPANTANYVIPEGSIQRIIEAWELINQGMEFDTAGDILTPLARTGTQQAYVDSKGKVSKAKVLDIFGEDTSWQGVFVDAEPDKLVFKNTWRDEILSINDQVRRAKLEDLINKALAEKELAHQVYKIIKPSGTTLPPHNTYLGDFGIYEDLGETLLYLNGKTDIVARVFGWDSRVNSDYKGRVEDNVVLINTTGRSGSIGHDSMVIGVHSEDNLTIGANSLVYDGSGASLKHSLEVKDKEALFIVPVQVNDGKGNISRAIVPVWRQLQDDPKLPKVWAGSNVKENLELIAQNALIETEFNNVKTARKGDVTLWDMPMWPVLKEGDDINEALGWMSKGGAPSELYKSSNKVSMSWLLKSFDYPGKVEQINADRASVALQQKRQVNPDQDLGGIDLSRKNMKMEVVNDGRGIDLKVDPALLAQFRQGNFTGVVPVVLRVMFVSNFETALGI